jgi:hypothetical protein
VHLPDEDVVALTTVVATIAELGGDANGNTGYILILQKKF